MVSVADLAATLQPLLTTVADQPARDSGFVQRVRTLTGAAFVQALVFWLARQSRRLAVWADTHGHCL